MPSFYFSFTEDTGGDHYRDF